MSLDFCLKHFLFAEQVLARVTPGQSKYGVLTVFSLRTTHLSFSRAFGVRRRGGGRRPQ